MKAALRSLLRRFGYDVRGVRMTPRQLLEPQNLRTLEFQDVVCRRMYALERPFRFVQVGAFDGVSNDPLHRFILKRSWQGVMVEPQPWAAQRLRDLYAGAPEVRILEAAVADVSGRQVLYAVEGQDAPSWAGGLASFDRENVLKHAHLIPNLEAMVRELVVPCVTFEVVLGLLGGKEIDLLQVDTEGADAEILACFPFHQMRPAIVHWEIKHLAVPERERCFERLLSYGYRLAPSGDEDMLAVQF